MTGEIMTLMLLAKAAISQKGAIRAYEDYILNIAKRIQHDRT